MTAAALFATLLSGCGAKPAKSAVNGVSSPTSPDSAPPLPDEVTFKDITDQAGIRFAHFTGARGRLYFPESEPPGCAFFDYDNDGRPDILITNSGDWPERKTDRRVSIMALYRNNGDTTFTDVTEAAGLKIPMYGMGVNAGDYDNDGWQDLYITCVLGPSRLYRNEKGRFRDVTKTAGVDNKGTWGSTSVWWDYDRDGRLDLFVGNYCQWTPKTDVFCSAHGGKKTYCTPNVYDGESCRLYHNNGDGTFTDVSQKSGLVYPPGKTWGAALLDFNSDGHLDICLANDMEPTALFKNNGNGTFTDVALETGVALGENGMAKAGMGIDAADIDNSGRESILISNFSGEGLSFFHNPDGALFHEQSVKTGMADTSLLFMGWGLFFFDYDLDGRKDALVGNGHLYPDVHKFQPDITYAERPLLYRNLGGLKFAEVCKEKGDLAKPIVARGISHADIDADGDLDVLICENNGKPRLYRNDGGNKNNWLRVKLIGKKSNRDGIGARLDTSAGGVTQMHRIRSGSSFMSTLERVATIGLGKNAKADSLKVTWPSGQVDTFVDVPANKVITVTEGEAAYQ